MAAGTEIVGCNSPAAADSRGGEDRSGEVRSSHGYMKRMISE